MAYKNKNKQKAHLKELKKTGWRKDNKKEADHRAIAKRNAKLPSIEDQMRRAGLL